MRAFTTWKFKSVIFLFFLLTNLTLSGQNTNSLEPLSSDSLFAKARQLAYNNSRAEARKVCHYLLSRDSTYLDAAVLMGRTYAWDGKYDSAQYILEPILLVNPGHYDALEALIDNNLYGKNYAQAIKNANIALSFHPGVEAFLLKKAKALNWSDQVNKSCEILNHLLSKDPSNKEASELLLSIRRNNMINKLTLDYYTNTFSDNTPWDFASIAMGRKMHGLGSVTLRYNYAKRFGKVGNQFELDAYPTVVKGVYIYLNAGISNKINFPITRLTMEPYFKLPHSFEFSIGFRYMNFDNKRLFALDSNKVMVYTGTIGKYVGNYWLSLRPYLTPGKGGWSKSVNLTVRRYLDDADSYLSLVVGSGISPDEQQYAFDPVLVFLKSNKITLDLQKKIAHRLFLNLGAGYAKEELSSTAKRNRYTFDIGTSFLF